MAHELENIEKLDEEFKAHIKEIQLYFKTFKWTNYELRLCRAWLYKLFNIDRCQILLRNAYLDKLMKQLLIGELNDPFNKFPQDNEPLIPLTTFLPINFNGRCDKTKNTQVHNLVSNMLNFPMTVVVHKYTGNHENYNAHIIKEIKMDESSNGKQISNIIDITATSKEKQGQKTTADNTERGDILILNHEIKIKLETIEQVYEELKIKNEILADQVQLYTDRNKLYDDCLTTTRDELSKIKNDVDEINKWKATKESEYFNNLKMFVDKTTEIDNRISQVILEVNDLKTAAKDESENKKCINDMMEVLEYMKEWHSLQITEKQRHFNEQTNKLEGDIEQLKANVNIKAKEVNSLEELVIIQNFSIDSYKKSLKEFLLLVLDK